jgi:hypothetical protein
VQGRDVVDVSVAKEEADVVPEEDVSEALSSGEEKSAVDPSQDAAPGARWYPVGWVLPASLARSDEVEEAAGSVPPDEARRRCPPKGAP